MGELFKKFASAFVEIEPDDSPGEPGSGSEKGPSLDDITQDASELLAQLDGLGDNAVSAGDESSSGLPGVQSQGPNEQSSVHVSKLDMTAQSVFSSEKIADGPNSAERILKLISGLSMFPQEQQVVMVRAMDGADASWSEEEVLDDARKRQSVLRRHLKDIETEREQRLGLLDHRIEETRSAGQKQIQDIDGRIAELQQQREALVVEITTMVGQFEQRKEDLQNKAEGARRGITSVVNAFSNLMSFFVGNNADSSG